MLVKKVSQSIPLVQGDYNGVSVSSPGVELLGRIAGIVAQGGGPTEISRCVGLSVAKYGPQSTPLVQGDRNGVPGSFPEAKLAGALAVDVAQGRGRTQINQRIDLWEAEHGPLGAAKRSSFTEAK